MNEKYKEIVETIQKFRVLSRIHVEEMFFSHTKNKKNNTNAVLKKLVDRNILTVNKTYSPYVYFIADTKIKKNGQKINQFLNIADVYLDMCRHGAVKNFEVEARFKGKVEIRPDLYAHWKGNLWFVECQNSVFSHDQMEQKIKRYEALYLSGEYKELPFQSESKPIMPVVLIVGEGVPYQVGSEHIRIVQAKCIDAFIEKTKKKPSNQGIVIKIG